MTDLVPAVGPDHARIVHHNLDTELADMTVIDEQGVRAVLHTTQHHEIWDDTTSTRTMY